VENLKLGDTQEEKISATLANQEEELEKSLRLYWHVYFVLYQKRCIL